MLKFRVLYYGFYLYDVLYINLDAGTAVADNGGNEVEVDMCQLEISVDGKSWIKINDASECMSLNN